MNAGQLQSLKDLIEFLKQQEVGVFDLEQGDLKVHLSFIGHGGPAGHADLGQTSHAMHSPSKTNPAPAMDSLATESHLSNVSAPSAAASPSSPTASEETGLHIVKSPIVGTFYEASAPGVEAFAKVGDQVESGQVICIVEAMKLMNEIECDASGEVVKRMVTNGQPVEYGQALFAIRPR